MIPEQRQELIRLLEKGEELAPEWARILFPPEKRKRDRFQASPDGQFFAEWRGVRLCLS